MAGVTVFDASALIALTMSSDTHHGEAVSMLSWAGDDELLISALTYAEVLVAPARRGMAKEFEQDIRHLGLAVAPVDPASAARFAEIRAKTTLSMPDCVALELAISKEANFLTFDEKLQKVAKGLSVKCPSPR